MPTTSPDTRAIARELDELGRQLCSRIAAGHYDQARQIADRCVALDTPGIHTKLLALLERARRLTIAQRSVAAMRLAALESANRYASTSSEQRRYLARG